MTNELNLIETPDESQEQTLGRRELLKALAATGGAVAMAGVVPTQWSKPVVEVGVLPAHAQISLIQGNLDVLLGWDTNDYDFNLVVYDPADGVEVWGGNPTSTTLQHGGDNEVAVTQFEEEETVTDRNDMVAPGSYVVYAEFAGGDDPVCDNTIYYSVQTDSEFEERSGCFTVNSGHATGYRKKLCRVIFPDGHITSIFEPVCCER